MRRVGWTDRWWIWRNGIVIQVEAGEPNAPVRSIDYDADDLLSWDWTTLPVDCELLGKEPDMQELMTVRPYDGLPDSADPLGLGCNLPTIDSIRK
ncbi:MAG: hypothetical protein EBR82_76400 [Caulobacteraceae bacterium]|nr:hypothetical protein [Caulobacteraceae bacterium]